MKKTFIAFASILAVGGAAFAGYSFRDAKFAQASDLYMRSPGGTCIAAQVNPNQLTSKFEVGVTIGQSKIVSAGGTNYTLWDNSNCNTTLGGQQVAVNP